MDLVIITGDQAIFDPSFPPATVVAPPGVITGTAKEKINGLLVCAAGDEASVVVPGATYFTPSFPIPGVGTLTIESLATDQQARKAKSGSRAVILKGTKFRARFQVNVPAQVVPPSGTPILDPTPTYSGMGSFVTTNTRVRME
jgi:contractile injection system spike tip protein